MTANLVLARTRQSRTVEGIFNQFVWLRDCCEMAEYGTIYDVDSAAYR